MIKLSQTHNFIQTFKYENKKNCPIKPQVTPQSQQIRPALPDKALKHFQVPLP
jgi:hypothetical protein